MKIVYIVPGIMDEVEMNRREKLLKLWAFPGTIVSIDSVEKGPRSIESMYEAYLSIPYVAQKLKFYEGEGFDAAIVGCAGDPGLDAMREISSMLVVGPGQASYLAAAALGNQFSIITIDEGMIQSHRDLAYKAGVSSKLASVRAVGVPVLDLMKKRDEVIDKLVILGEKMIKEDGADTLVLGCMSMGFLNVAEVLQKKLRIPVINPSKYCLKQAESLVSTGLNHSKKAFSLPPKLRDERVTSLEEMLVSK